jgi:hypothetical protein
MRLGDAKTISGDGDQTFAGWVVRKLRDPADRLLN